MYRSYHCKGFNLNNNEQFSFIVLSHFYCYYELNELPKRVPIHSVSMLILQYMNACTEFLLMFSNYFHFSILGDEVSHISPFSKPF